MRRPRLSATLLLLGLLGASTAQATSLRCGSALITRDDSTHEVLSKCGEPVSRDFLGYRERLDIYGFRNEIAVEEWTYGPRNGMYHFLRFEAGRLVSIGSKRGN
ncbi:Protein of unknown function [Pseudomonas cuatrocienegasensis]|uniref:DUF2845 domain-containing protein n=1 Tax=Pseudomonas cuatrocienegasensis TaxID=543360 RepID=A0ABY1BLK0_9PSED|nr:MULTISPECIES: DUF2845 domain-containing protein [Pseudomonas]OEC34341.1 hypothetical protein A7D25_14130 [Pseudomonas sp. 21C1]SER10847.1 Protein of unknown function [Pseudomonas cuatrocienegasensis]